MATMLVPPLSTQPARAGVRLMGNSVWTMAGNGIYAVCQWLIVIAIAKLGSEQLVGRFALGLAVTAPLFQFANLQLRAVHVTDARGDYRFDQYFGLRIVCTAAALAVAALIAAAGSYSRETALVIVLVAVAKSIECLSDLLQGVLQRQERMDLVSRSLIYKGVASVVAVGLTLGLAHSLVASTAAMIGAWLLVFLVFDVRRARRALRGLRQVFLPSFSLRVFRGIFVLTVPLGVVMMLSSLSSNIPRYFVERQGSERELGIFSALLYGMVAVNLVVLAAGQSASPRLANHYAAGEMRLFRRLLSRLLLLAGGVGAAAIAIAAGGGRTLLSLLYRPGYGRHAEVFVLLMVAAAFNAVSTLLGVAMTAMRGFTPQFWIHFAGTAICSGACAVLIPRMGMLGAAAAVDVWAAAMMIGFGGIVWRRLRAIALVRAGETR